MLLVKYFFDLYGFTSAGAIAALVQGLLAKELWKRGLPRIAASDAIPSPLAFYPLLPCLAGLAASEDRLKNKENEL